MITDPISFTILDACRATGLGRTTIYSLISEGKLEACKAGARTLIRAESLRRYIASLAPAQVKMAPRART